MARPGGHRRRRGALKWRLLPRLRARLWEAGEGGGSKRLGRRSAQNIAEVVGRIVALLEASPKGLRAERSEEARPPGRRSFRARSRGARGAQDQQAGAEARHDLLRGLPSRGRRVVRPPREGRSTGAPLERRRSPPGVDPLCALSRTRRREEEAQAAKGPLPKAKRAAKPVSQGGRSGRPKAGKAKKADKPAKGGGPKGATRRRKLPCASGGPANRDGHGGGGQRAERGASTEASS